MQRLEDEDCKRRRIVELRRKRHEEKQRKIQKEMDRMKYIADVERAKQFYRFRTLKFVFRKFRNLIKWKRRNEKISKEFNCSVIKRNILFKWKDHVQKIWNNRKAKADQFYSRHCLELGMNLWKKYYLVEHSKQLVADDWYDMRLTERVFHRWNRITELRRMSFEIKRKQAEAHHEWYWFRFNVHYLFCQA